MLLLGEDLPQYLRIMTRNGERERGREKLGERGAGEGKGEREKEIEIEI